MFRSKEGWLSWHPQAAPTIIQCRVQKRIAFTSRLLNVFNTTLLTSRSPIATVLLDCGHHLEQTLLLARPGTNMRGGLWKSGRMLQTCCSLRHFAKAPFPLNCLKSDIDVLLDGRTCKASLPMFSFACSDTYLNQEQSELVQIIGKLFLSLEGCSSARSDTLPKPVPAQLFWIRTVTRSEMTIATKPGSQEIKLVLEMERIRLVGTMVVQANWINLPAEYVCDDLVAGYFRLSGVNLPLARIPDCFFPADRSPILYSIRWCLTG